MFEGIIHSTTVLCTCGIINYFAKQYTRTFINSLSNCITFHATVISLGICSDKSYMLCALALGNSIKIQMLHLLYDQ